eukprot:6717082-Pyramimonas_sp.AAC.1
MTQWTAFLRPLTASWAPLRAPCALCARASCGSNFGTSRWLLGLSCGLSDALDGGPEDTPGELWADKGL